MMTQEELLFFSGHPEALALYTLLKEGLLRRYPDTLFLPAKTQISLKNAFVFGAASLPRSKSRKGLMLTLGLPSLLDSPRVQHTSQPWPGRWTHHIFLKSPDEVDGEIWSWLDAAICFARKKHR